MRRVRGRRLVGQKSIYELNAAATVEEGDFGLEKTLKEDDLASCVYGILIICCSMEVMWLLPQKQVLLLIELFENLCFVVFS